MPDSPAPSFHRKPLTGPEDLALFGAPPVFDTPRHVNRPAAPDRAAFDAMMDAVWERRWFTNDGPLVQELERRLSAFLDVPHCVLTSNATAGLDLVMQCLGIRGEVLLPSYTFISTAHLLALRGLTPVFCEVGTDMALDPADAAARLTERTDAVVATHVWGSPCDIDGLGALCDAAGIPLLFDAAHAFGARHRGHPLGRFGRAEVFSLHATKAFHTCEGGLITTCDAALAEQLRLARNFGFSGSDRVDCTGVNAKMSELHAAMGLANLDAFPATRAAARAVHAAYRDGLARLAAYGTMLGLEDRASEIAATLESRLAEVRALVEAQGGTALILMTNGPKLSVFGPESRFGWLHTEVGFRPAVDGITDSRHGEAVSFEYVAQADPGTLLVIDRGAAIADGTQAASATLDTPLVRGTKAAQAGRVIYLSPAELYIATGGVTSLTRTLDEIAAALGAM